jgi:GT2 family glycosyltransferase
MDSTTGQAGAGRLVAVVVTHDRLAQLQVTLGRLLACPDRDLAGVLVVDNASRDGTAAWLGHQDDPRLTVLRLEENRGGAGGFEAGMRLAVARLDPDWIVVMDDDARPEPQALAAFAAMDRRGWDALAAAVRYPGGGICEMNRPSRNPFWHAGAFLRTLLGGGRAGFHLSDADYAGGGVQPVDAASFVGLFLSRAALARAGFPDGGLFLYGDDVIYTLRLSAAGGRIGFAPGVRFEHDCSSLRKTGGHALSPIWKTYYNYRNGLLAYRLAAGPVWFWPVLAVVVPKWALRAQNHPPGMRGLFLRILARAVADGLAGRTARPHAEVLAMAPPPPGE